MMFINDLINQANANKRKIARGIFARRWAIGLCIATTAASLGVVTGILVAPKSGKDTRVGLRKKAAKSVATIEKAILGKTGDK